MTTAQLVRKLLELGASPEVVEVCLDAIEAAKEEIREEARPKPRVRARRKPEIVASRA